MEQRLRILALSNLYPPFHQGGYGIICHRICSSLAERGYEILVATSDPRDLPGRDTVAREYSVFPENLRVLRELRWINAGRPLEVVARTAANRCKIVEIARRWQPDLVYAFGVDGIGFDTYDAVTSLDIPHLTLVGDTWLSQAWRDLPRFDPWIALASGKGATGITRRMKQAFALSAKLRGSFTGIQPRSQGPVQCISQFLLDDLRSTPASLPPASCVIPCHLTSEFFTPAGEPIGRPGARARSLRAIFVGRVELLKGPDTAIAGVAAACRAGADVTLTLLGLQSDGLRARLDALARELGIASRVRWEKAADTVQLIQQLQEHDVFLFPSRILEGFGQVNIEAMACGLPVLGTGVGGSGELILDGITGRRFAPGDVDLLAAHLRDLANDRSELERLSLGALNQARGYHPTALLDRIESLLARVVKPSHNTVQASQQTMSVV